MFHTEFQLTTVFKGVRMYMCWCVCVCVHALRVS